jgi:hypothetical protein
MPPSGWDSRGQPLGTCEDYFFEERQSFAA